MSVYRLIIHYSIITATCYVPSKTYTRQMTERRKTASRSFSLVVPVSAGVPALVALDPGFVNVNVVMKADDVPAESRLIAIEEATRPQ